MADDTRALNDLKAELARVSAELKSFREAQEKRNEEIEEKKTLSKNNEERDTKGTRTVNPNATEGAGYGTPIKPKKEAPPVPKRTLVNQPITKRDESVVKFVSRVEEGGLTGYVEFKATFSGIGNHTNYFRFEDGALTDTAALQLSEPDYITDGSWGELIITVWMMEPDV